METRAKTDNKNKSDIKDKVTQVMCDTTSHNLLQSAPSFFWGIVIF